ncbi:hypothetical protein [Actinacidiphila sp. ITFR-21]|uniref:hypothetical protein n=1 Tax=Actinacidiphila sp. ITFR-21 TaxID=3075199 RepID=UPI00288C11FE|nr:hypothetical protein [Streptomyces sp. ITFR-21]WNI15758.1 hypothetical protein RLT57_09625 [Streptomyces sp. ITFR-21]
MAVAAPRRPPLPPARPPRRPGRRRPTPYPLFGGACWLLLAVVTWHTPIASDFGQHAAAVEQVRADWRHPGNPLLKAPGTGSPYYSPYIVLLGLVAKATGAAGWTVVRCCGPVNLALLVAGVGAYARTLSGRPWAPVYALAAFTLLWGVRGTEWSGFCGVWSLTRGACYPSTFAVGLSFLLWAGADRLARRGGPARCYAGLGLLGAVLLLIHPVTALAAVVGAVATVAGRQRRWSARAAARWGLAAAVAVAAAGVWPYFDVFALAGDTSLDYLHRRLYQHPFRWYGLAAAGLPALLRRAVRRPRDPLAVMFALFAVLAGYGWLSGHYVYGRVFALALVPLQFSLAVALAAPRPWAGPRRALLPVAAVALCCGLVAQAGAVVPRRFLPVALDHPRRWHDYRWVTRLVPPGEVVLTDGYAATHALPAYGIFLIAPTWPDPAAPAADTARRSADLRAYFAPGSDASVRRLIVRRYDARWLLLTRGEDVPYEGRSVAWSEVSQERLVRLSPEAAGRTDDGVRPALPHPG